MAHTHTFNTGRQYTKNGQIISLKYTGARDKDWPDMYLIDIYFNDTSRHITGKFKNVFIALDDPGELEKVFMDYYDNGGYEMLSVPEFKEV